MSIEMAAILFYSIWGFLGLSAWIHIENKYGWWTLGVVEELLASLVFITGGPIAWILLISGRK